MRARVSLPGMRGAEVQPCLPARGMHAPGSKRATPLRRMVARTRATIALRATDQCGAPARGALTSLKARVRNRRRWQAGAPHAAKSSSPRKIFRACRIDCMRTRPSVRSGFPLRGCARVVRTQRGCALARRERVQSIRRAQRGSPTRILVGAVGSVRELRLKPVRSVNCRRQALHCRARGAASTLRL
jgi:hypothetical protein